MCNVKVITIYCESLRCSIVCLFGFIHGGSLSYQEEDISIEISGGGEGHTLTLCLCSLLRAFWVSGSGLYFTRRANHIDLFSLSDFVCFKGQRLGSTGVPLHQQLLVEGPAAVGAAVEPLARVRGHVLRQVELLFEALPAERAAEGLLPRVDPQVGLEVALEAKGSAAERAAEGPGSSVKPGVAQ